MSDQHQQVFREVWEQYSYLIEQGRPSTTGLEFILDCERLLGSTLGLEEKQSVYNGTADRDIKEKLGKAFYEHELWPVESYMVEFGGRQ